MYSRNKKFTSYKRERREDYMDHTMYDDHSKGPNSEGQIDTLIGLKARRNLPKSAYSIQADPYEASLPASNPYDLIAPFNKTVGGKYAGTDNLDGGNVQQYANSFNSKTLKAFDFIKLKLATNYRFIPRRLARANVPTVSTDSGGEKVVVYNPVYVGSGLIDMQRQSIAEATSILQATTFTQMAINYYAVESDLPMGDAEFTILTTGTGQTAVDHAVVVSLPDVIYAASSFYQIFWQEVHSLIDSFNSFRLKQGTMIRSSWNRETPTLNSLFGLFNKKAFLSLMDSICLSMEGEYIDQPWVAQNNLLSFMPSRRTNSIHDPVLEIQTRNQHPDSFVMYLLDETGRISGKVFDSTESLVWTDPADQSQTISFFDVIDELKDLFSAANVMHWARNTTVRANFAQNAYYNRAVKLLDLVQEACTTVKIKFNDVREVFDVIARTGLNSWTKKVRPSITKSTDIALFDNLIINDIYRTVFSGATTISLDAATKRWRSFTMWDMYDGIPSYDAKSGGCFLTFSGKTIESGVDADQIKKWVPIAFYIDSTSQTVAGEVPSLSMINREGDQVDVTVASATMSTHQAFARLVPLASQASAEIRVPTIASISNAYEASFAINVLCNIFGYCSVGSRDYIDPDLLYVYEIELSDITNDAIRYARVYSPFKGAAPEGDLIGFEKFGQE